VGYLDRTPSSRTGSSEENGQVAELRKGEEGRGNGREGSRRQGNQKRAGRQGQERDLSGEVGRVFVSI
jgi:hypothetical protein